MLKNLLIVLLSVMPATAYAQTGPEFDGSKWNAPYKLDVPEGWNTERFLIPIEFAPQIPYKGIEDIRFAPGWGDVKTNDYWTYAFLWYLDSTPKTDEKVIEQNLTAYYNGLVGRNITRRKIPAEKVITTKVSIKKTDADKGDLETYNGTIAMLDYMEQKPITLNCIVHLKTCPGQTKFFIFYEISPKPKDDVIWQKLNQLWSGFDCKK